MQGRDAGRGTLIMPGFSCSYIWQHIEIGYVQGMCDLLAPLLVILDDGECAPDPRSVGGEVSASPCVVMDWARTETQQACLVDISQPQQCKMSLCPCVPPCLAL